MSDTAPTTAKANTPAVADLGWPMQSERLSLRPATRDDADATWRYHQLEPVVRWLSHRPSTIDEHRTHFADDDRLTGKLVVELEGIVIGDVHIRIQSPWAQAEVRDRAENTEAELGWVFDPEYGGRGYATETLRELFRICFDELGLRRVIAYCFADNDPSWRLMERAGMRREMYSIRDSPHRTRGWLDGMGYALLADEYYDRH